MINSRIDWHPKVLMLMGLLQLQYYPTEKMSVVHLHICCMLIKFESITHKETQYHRNFKKSIAKPRFNKPKDKTPPHQNPHTSTHSQPKYCNQNIALKLDNIHRH